MSQTKQYNLPPLTQTNHIRMRVCTHPLCASAKTHAVYKERATQKQDISNIIYVHIWVEYRPNYTFHCLWHSYWPCFKQILNPIFTYIYIWTGYKMCYRIRIYKIVYIYIRKVVGCCCAENFKDELFFSWLMLSKLNT